MDNDQPDIEVQKQLAFLESNKYTLLTIPGTKDKLKIGWLKRGCLKMLTRLSFEIDMKIPEGEKEQRLYEKKKGDLAYKAASAILLNNFWKIKLFNSLYWRYLAYIKEYDHNQILSIIYEGEKKNPLQSFYMAMELLKIHRTTIKAETKEEIEAKKK